MPTPEMESAYRTARERSEAAAEELRTQLVTIALASLSEVLPGAASIDVVGQFDEDWILTLHIQRVRSADGLVLFDVDAGHPEPVTPLSRRPAPRPHPTCRRAPHASSASQAPNT